MKNLKIRSKLLVSFGVVLVLTILVSLYSILQLRKASNNLNEFMEGSVAADDAVKACRIATFMAATDVRNRRSTRARQVLSLIWRSCIAWIS